MGFQEFLISTEELGWEVSQQRYRMYSVDNLFVLNKIDSKWFWYLTGDITMKYSKLKPLVLEQTKQVGCSSWVKARNQVISFYQKIYPDIYFNPQVKSSKISYQIILQSNVVPIEMFKYKNDKWSPDVHFRMNNKNIIIQQYNTRKLLLEHLHNYVNQNLYNLYQKDKQIYLNNRKLLLANITTTFKPWWSGFVKLEIDLSQVF